MKKSNDEVDYVQTTNGKLTMAMIGHWLVFRQDHESEEGFKARVHLEQVELSKFDEPSELNGM